MAIDRKWDAISKLRADILVVPECAERPAAAHLPGVSFTWRGENRTKGLGVFGFNGWQPYAAAAETDLGWVLPLHITGPECPAPLLLLATWTRSPDKNGTPDYPVQVRQLIETWTDPLKAGRAVVAGDLNCSIQGPSQNLHADNIRTLEQLGMFSASHHHNQEPLGQETAMTLRWIGPGRRVYDYHCDYIFVSRDLLAGLRAAEVGAMADWIGPTMSDHCPVIVDLDV